MAAIAPVTQLSQVSTRTALRRASGKRSSKRAAIVVRASCADDDIAVNKMARFATATLASAIIALPAVGELRTAHIEAKHETC